MFAIYSVISYLVLCLGQITSLVEFSILPEKNIYLSTEFVVRDTINTLFTYLRLKNVFKKYRLNEYSKVDNHLVSIMTQNDNALGDIVKVTKVNSTLNNDISDFMTVINELLDEDVGIKALALANASVIDYINMIMLKLENLKKEHNVTSNDLPINADIYQTMNNNNIAIKKCKSKHSDTSEETYNKWKNDDPLFGGDSDYWRQEQRFRRIYRGERTKIKYFPFMASVHIFNRFFCSGAIIKSDLVVTAASCLQLAYNNRYFRENPAFLSVRVGTKYIIGGESIPVLEIYFYPTYDPKNLHNNICVLRLIRKINFKRKRVKKIAIDRVPSTLSQSTEGITILGWGARKMNNVIVNPPQNILSFAVLDVYPLIDCQEVYSDQYVTKKNFCAGFFSKGGGACNHDVGGPGVMNGILMGVVSFGSPVCGSPDAPTVFSKIGYYADWIDDIMKQDVPTRSKKTTLLPQPILSINKYEPSKTSFEIVPLDDKSTSNLVVESNSLRIQEDSEVFKNDFSSVIVNKDSDVQVYQDLFPAEELPATTLTLITDVPRTTDAPITIAPFTKINFDGLTPLGDVDPVDETTYELMHSAELINPDDEIHNKTVHSDHILEKDLVNVIDNKDLKKIIDNISSLEEEKLLENTKLLDLIKGRHIDDRKTKGNDSVLTLLYFSESEKNGGDFKNVGSIDDENDNFDNEGLSISTDPFKDLTLRNKNVSIFDDNLLKQNIYDIISETLEENMNKNN